MSMDSINRELGALSEGLRHIAATLESADVSRKLMWDKLNAIDLGMAELRHKQSTTDELVRTLKPHVDEFVTYKTNAQGAGKLGRLLWIIGGVLLAGAAWIMELFQRIQFK